MRTSKPAVGIDETSYRVSEMLRMQYTSLVLREETLSTARMMTGPRYTTIWADHSWPGWRQTTLTTSTTLATKLSSPQPSVQFKSTAGGDSRGTDLSFAQAG
jgi:hypothetical protein